MADSEVKPLPRFSRIRNNISAERLGDGELVDAVNVDLDDAGAPSLRDGYEPLEFSGLPVHSLWADGDDCLFRIDAQGFTLLSRMTLDSEGAPAITFVCNGLTPGAPMSYAAHNGSVYMSDGAKSLVVNDVVRTWGLPVPEIQVEATGGQLPPGRYLVSATYVDEQGRESGAMPGVEVDLPGGGGILVTIPDAPPDGFFAEDGEQAPTTIQRDAFKVVYCTTANGEVLYEAGGTTHGTTTALVSSDTLNFQRPLSTMFYGPPPPGDIVAIWRGHAFIAVGPLVFYSAPFGLEWFRGDQYWQFESAVTMIAPAEDGIYIGTETQTLWMAGMTPEAMTVVQRHDQGAVRGSLTQIPIMALQGREGEYLTPAWLSNEGICAGLPGGTLVNLTEQWRFTAPPRAATLFRRRQNGFQLITTLSGA